MAFTTKEVRPVFERNFGSTRRFVVKGDVAFTVLATGEPVFGFVACYGLKNVLRVEPCVSINSAPVPLSVVPPQWFANAASKFIPDMGMHTQRDYWTTLVVTSKALGGNCGTIDLSPQHPFTQGTRIAHFVITDSKRANALDADGKLIGSYTRAGVMQALTSTPGPIISWS